MSPLLIGVLFLGCAGQPEATPTEGVLQPDGCGAQDPTGSSLKTWYLDNDGDGHGGAEDVTACQPPSDRYVDQQDDCDDSDADVYPGAPELPGDGVDNDCDGYRGLLASCAVTPATIAPPFEYADWDGSASSDDSGEIIDHTWMLTASPEGSAVELREGDELRPDLAGEYVGMLTVTNDQGETDTCERVLEVIPAQRLWIEMFWEKKSDDMDLHLLQPDGIPFTRGDCHWENCTDGSLDWGESGEEDDPRLDLEDEVLTGPEIINIPKPAPGVYTVMVHDYYYLGLSDDEFGDNAVTVNIFIDGDLVWSDTRVISGEDSKTDFAEIEWPQGNIRSL